MNLSLFGQLAIAMSACAAQKPAQDTFAGWIRSSSCSVLLQNPARKKAIPLNSTQTTAFKLYAGQSVRAVGSGVVKLLIYGHEHLLTPEKGWYPIPKSKDQAPKGQDIYVKFTSRAGMPRGEKANPESIWRAFSLTDLVNPNPHSPVKIHGSIHLESGQRVATSKTSTVKTGAHFWFEAENDSNIPVFVSIVDIDCAAGVDVIPSKSNGGPIRLAPHSGWIRCGELMTADLPTGFKTGIERFRFIATTHPVDLFSLASKSAPDPRVEFEPTKNPLANLIKMCSGSDPKGLTDWGLDPVDVTFKR